MDKGRRVVTVADALPLKGNESAPAVDLVVFTLAMNQRLRCVARAACERTR